MDSLPVEKLASFLRTEVESSLRNDRQDHHGFTLSSVLSIEEDLIQALSAIQWIRNTFAPINKLHPELLASITTYVDNPSGGNASCADLQFFCATVCRYWRNSLLAFPEIWSSVDTTNSRHMKLYLPRSKKAPLHVYYGWESPLHVFNEHIFPERHRLQSLSISFQSPGINRHAGVTFQSVSEPAESLKTLDMYTTGDPLPMPSTTMVGISRFAANITFLKLYDITAGLSFLQFPSLVKLTFRVTKLYDSVPEPDAADLVGFLRHSPLLEELDLYLPEGFKTDAPASTVTLEHLKSAVFNGSSTPSGSVSVKAPLCLRLPNRSITVDVQTRARTFSSKTSPLLSVIQLGDAILSQRQITAAAIHIKDTPTGFFGHIGICGEDDNWIGINHVRVLGIGKSPLLRVHDWLDPVDAVNLSGIRTLTLGLFQFASDQEQCIEVLRTFLRGLGQVRVLNVYKMDVSLVARILQPSDGAILFPLLEELRFHVYDPPELTRCLAHDSVQPGPGKGPMLRSSSESEQLRVRELRHKLQKAFLGKEIKEEDMEACNELFNKLEDYDEMTLDLLSYSKIGKVIRHIGQKENIPRQEEFMFQERSKKLLEQWSRISTMRPDDYAKGLDFKWLGNINDISSVLLDMMKARRECIGSVGGLSEVVVQNASGSSVSVILQ